MACAMKTSWWVAQMRQLATTMKRIRMKTDHVISVHVAIR